MSDIAKKTCVLKLNANWQPIGYGSVDKALIDLVRGDLCKALDIQYKLNDDGYPDFDSPPVNMSPLDWDDWIKLPIRPWDFVIHSTKLTIRVPTIIISKNYSKMPMKFWNNTPSKDDIYQRDNGICQYTGKKIDRSKFTVDHIIPKSKGGKETWGNLVTTSKELNFRKGNSYNDEVGLKLIKTPRKPAPVPISSLIREIKHKDWKLFLNK